jgi:O-antigen/teichoic acid export membrane protein
MIASRHIDKEEESREVYDILANSFVLVFILSGIIIFFSRFGGDTIITSFYNDPELLPTLQLMVLSLPLVGIIRLVISSTHAMVIMKWDALSWNFLRPVLLLVFAILFAGQKTPALALGQSYFLTNLILSIGLLMVFGSYFSYRKLLHHIIHFKLNRELIRFSIPQSLNMTFNKFITDLDLIMLGFFQFSPALISFYGMGSQLVRNIRKVKAAFAGIYAPIISRIRAAGDTQAMNKTFSMIANWTTMVALPLAVLVIVFRNELLSVFHPSFGTQGVGLMGSYLAQYFDLASTATTFMVFLVMVPLLDCIFGMAGNIIAMSGYSGWNLFNAILVAALNAALNYLLIPLWGLVGAALASVIATLLVVLLQLLEANCYSLSE